MMIYHQHYKINNNLITKLPKNNHRMVFKITLRITINYPYKPKHNQNHLLQCYNITPKWLVPPLLCKMLKIYNKIP